MRGKQEWYEESRKCSRPEVIRAYQRGSKCAEGKERQPESKAVQKGVDSSFQGRLLALKRNSFSSAFRLS